MSTTTPFRIIFNATKRGPKIFSIQASRPISTHSYRGQAPYKEGSQDRQDVIDTTYDGAANLGFDSHGAVRAEIGGGFHDHTPGGGPAGKRWITVQLFDANNKVLYHKKQDGSEWDRIHLYRDPQHNLTAAERPVEIYTK